MPITFLDLFAGAGGLSEGFIQAGYTPIAHIEKDKAACFTLKTRNAFYFLKKENKLDIYYAYLHGKISRNELYSHIPQVEFDSVICKAISKENREELFQKTDTLLGNKKLDLVIGGPPCQAYSLIGRSSDKNKMLGDERNYLYLEYVEFLKKYKPKFFVFENVTGLLSAKDTDNSRHFDKMLNAFKEAGYSAKAYTFNASDYGLPQNRKRIIIIGSLSQNVINFSLSKSDHSNTAHDFISDLPHLKAGTGKIFAVSKTQENQLLKKLNICDIPYITFHQARPHNKRDLEIYKLVVESWNKYSERLKYNELPKRLINHKNLKSFLDRFKVVVADQPSHTVVAHISKDGHYYIHPDITQNRSLTVREVARLQTFPDSYFFESESGKPARTTAYTQVGNAVPVLLANQIAHNLKDLIKKASK